MGIAAAIRLLCSGFQTSCSLNASLMNGAANGKKDEAMGQADYFAPGQHNFICDQCGFKLKSNDKRKQWDGLIVCSKCYDPRHPQDFVRGKRDRQSVPNPRPDPDPEFV